MHNSAVFASKRADARHYFGTARLVVPLLALALLLAGCSASGAKQSSNSAGAAVTITFWHGWSLPNDVGALQGNIAKFEKLHPNITVKTVPNVSDDKILQGLRTSTGPDVISSFTTGSVGALCQGALVDLNPKLKADGIDKNTTFIPSRIRYTEFGGKQCTLPLLGDAFGLYYNKEMFTAAGIIAPPKTWTEFTADAVKLTHMKKDGSYASLGFMPSFEMYETDVGTWMKQWDPKYYDAQGKANLANDPNVSRFFQYADSLQKALGGYAPLHKYRTTFGDEWSAQNPFEVGKIAMALDGEWRIGLIKTDSPKLDYAVAPLPVPDDQLSTYGKGSLTGTIIGISRKSQHQQAAWELVKYLTSDTNALVSFGNAIQNLPSTLAALKSPELPSDPAFQTFLRISENPMSGGTPASNNGGQYLTILGRFGDQWQSGKVSDLHQGLVDVDKQIDAANAQTAP